MNNLKLDGLELMIKRTKASIESVEKEVAVCQSLVSDDPTEQELSILIGHKSKKHKLKLHLLTLEEKYNSLC